MDSEVSSKRVLSSGPDIERFLEDAAQCTAEFARKARISYGIPPTHHITHRTRAVEIPGVDSPVNRLPRLVERLACCCKAVRRSTVAGVGSDPTKMVVQGRGWKTAPLILGSAIGERLGSTAISYNLIVYLTSRMNLSLVKAVCISSASFGASSLAPILGVFLADAYLGRITTLAAGSIFYLGGLVLFTLLYMEAGLRPPVCDRDNSQCQPATSFQMTILFLSLTLQTMGSGAIRPCAAPCAADQFDENNPKHQKQIQNFFDWYKACMTSAMIIGATVIIYIQTKVDWGWGSIVLSCTMGLSLVVLLFGNPFYRSVDATNSPLRSLVQVMVAAIRKRKLSLPANPDVLYQVKTLGVNDVLLLHTENMRWLDKAAILEDWKDNIDPKDCNSWRLCTLQQVEELKKIFKMTPVWLCTSVSAIVYIQTVTVMTKQALTMDLRVGKHFEVPAASMGAFSILTFVLFVPLYDACIVKVLRKLTGQARGLTCLQRIGVGMLIGILTMALSALVEDKRRRVAIQFHSVDEVVGHLPISGFWLFPQFVLAGLGESFVVPGLLEFFYDETPNRIQSTSKSFGWAALGMGGMLNAILVSILQVVTISFGEANGWLHDNINRGRLDFFYISLAVLGIIVSTVYGFIASSYVYVTKTNHDLGHTKLHGASAGGLKHCDSEEETTTIC